MVYINLVFSLVYLVSFGGKTEKCEIPESFWENPDYFGRFGI
jgi:hypothetical protein